MPELKRDSAPKWHGKPTANCDHILAPAIEQRDAEIAKVADEMNAYSKSLTHVVTGYSVARRVSYWIEKLRKIGGE